MGNALIGAGPVPSGDDNFATGIVVDQSHNVYLAGRFYAPITFGSIVMLNTSGTDLYLAKYSLPSLESPLKSYDNSEEVFIYPNPTSNELTVSLNEKQNNRQLTDIQLTDMTGRTVGKKISFKANYTEAKLDVTSIADGIYLLQVTTTTFTHRLKIAIKH